jgi:hypothetical protein
MTLTAEQAAARALDRPWSDGQIEKIEETEGGWEITMPSAGFFLKREDLGAVDPPAVGDEVTTYTHQGSLIRGIDLRGEPVFYKTQDELDADHEKWQAEHTARRKQEFEEAREELDYQFASLPAVFQRRISWFRAWDPDFRWKSEAYEMSACVDAVKIAEQMKTPEEVVRFREMPYEEQREAVPDLYDGHSGNSFGMAVRLAWLYLSEPLLVIAEHGALTPLVGCEEYGCAHPRPPDVIAAAEGAMAE